MKAAEPKPSARDDPVSSPYEEMFGKPISEVEEAEMNFNLVNFVETLIAMDKQHKQWIKENQQVNKENQDE